MSWADAKKKARQAVQDTFSLSVIFYETSASTPTVEADTVSARIHDKSAPVGDLAGTNLSYAEVMERPTRAIFEAVDMVGRNLQRGSMIVGKNYMDQIVGYHVENLHPTDGLTKTVDVTPLSDTELSGKLLPDGTTVP